MEAWGTCQWQSWRLWVHPCTSEHTNKWGKKGKERNKRELKEETQVDGTARAHCAHHSVLPVQDQGAMWGFLTHDLNS